MSTSKHVYRKLIEINNRLKQITQLLTNINIPFFFSPVILLKLSKIQINAYVALFLVGGTATASEVQNVLNVTRAMASKALNELWRIGLIHKSKMGYNTIFKLIEE